MNGRRPRPLAAALMVGTLAGLAGGVVEIGWVGLYAAATGTPVAPVARGVVEALIPGGGTLPHAVALGILAHLALAVVLGNVLVFAMRLLGRHAGGAPAEFLWVTAALVAVWAINFFVILPQLSPSFASLLPFGITMLSKLLFGVAAAAVLRGKREYWTQPAR
jgi:hypothetical protein